MRRDTLEALCAEKTRWLTLTEVRKVLNLSRRSAYTLVSSGKLRPLSGPSIDGRPIWKFTENEIIELASKERADPKFDQT